MDVVVGAVDVVDEVYVAGFVVDMWLLLLLLMSLICRHGSCWWMLLPRLM
jgi:hypothetical protein